VTPIGFIFEKSKNINFFARNGFKFWLILLKHVSFFNYSSKLFLFLKPILAGTKKERLKINCPLSKLRKFKNPDPNPAAFSFII
jgi:hypothetical protein